MDLVKTLRDRISALEAGDHTPGLGAVLQHIEAAVKHLTHGSSTADDSAFTDVIYRTNQAFEGGLKEVYRVLASADPSRKTPFEIENYLQGHNILRQRVLDHLSTYRKDWRNPATHDYKLDFDEDEALLAIVSVCVFAIVLVDQISFKLSYDKAAAATPPASPAEQSKPLLAAVVDFLLTFHTVPTSGAVIHRVLESELVGAVAGLLSTALPGLDVALEPRLSPSAPYRADLVLKRGDEKLLVEFKRAARSPSIRNDALDQVSRYVAVSGIKDSVLYFFDERGRQSTDREDYQIPGTDGRIVIISPGKP